MTTIPHGETNGWSVQAWVHRLLDRILILGEIAFMAYDTFWPIFDTLPGRGIQLLNNSEIELRYDWRYVVGFHIGYVLMLATLLMI